MNENGAVGRGGCVERKGFLNRNTKQTLLRTSHVAPNTSDFKKLRNPSIGPKAESEQCMLPPP